ncbi:hypothetical protein ACFU99_40970, partial [Streptomyces sp. NPDC057654]
MPLRRARRQTRLAVTAAAAALTLGAGALPALASPSGARAAHSAWGDHGRAAIPEVKAGANRPPASRPSAAPSTPEQAWR